MRKVASVQNAHPTIRRVILYECDACNCTYVFPCTSDEDGSSIGDEWYPTTAEAYVACARQYGIRDHDWREIPDPLPGCQDDWIAPVRVPGRAEGNPQWGTLERLGPDGVWRPIREASDGSWQDVK